MALWATTFTRRAGRGRDSGRPERHPDAPWRSVLPLWLGAGPGVRTVVGQSGIRTLDGALSYHSRRVACRGRDSGRPERHPQARWRSRLSLALDAGPGPRIVVGQSGIRTFDGALSYHCPGRRVVAQDQDVLESSRAAGETRPLLSDPRRRPASSPESPPRRGVAKPGPVPALEDQLSPGPARGANRAESS